MFLKYFHTPPSMDIPSLAEAIEESIRQSVEGKRVAVAFSGGVDSTLLATVAKRDSRRVDLLTVYGEGSEAKDRLYAFRLAHTLSLPLHLAPLRREEVRPLMEEVVRVVPFVKGNFVKVDVLVPVLKALKEAKALSFPLLLFGSGTEELFAGYDRHYRWLEEGLSEEEVDRRLRQEYRALFFEGDIHAISLLAEHVGVEVAFPLASEKVAEMAFAFPLTERMADRGRKKAVLRRAAQILGVPQEAVERRKQALQYGSKSHRMVKEVWNHGSPEGV